MEPKYLTKIREMIDTGEIPSEAGSVSVVDVKHDDWCGIFRGGPCNCDPDIHVQTIPPSVREGLS